MTSQQGLSLKTPIQQHQSQTQKRNQFYEVDHLATFQVGAKQGLLTAEDGMRKLRIMEKSQGVWTLECRLMIENDYLILIDKKNGQELDAFPIERINEPTSVVSEDKNIIHNNILLFTVLEDVKSSRSLLGNQTNVTPTEMHFFQCKNINSTEIVDEIFKIKYLIDPKLTSVQKKSVDQFDSYQKYSDDVDNSNNYTNKRVVNYQHQSNSLSLNKQKPNYELDLKILNACFDDIERFVTRLQNSSEHYKELEKRNKKQIKNKKSNLGNGVIDMRAQMPPKEEFVDIFQKIKLSFNLLAKLKGHIHDPNAPELVHFLFTPLALIVNTTKEEPYQSISKSIWNPLITKEAKDLLANCLTSKEQNLWLSLGECWNITREETKMQPHLFNQIENQSFNPVFNDGWTPNIVLNDQTDMKTDMSRLAYETAAQAQKHQYQHQFQQNQAINMQKTRYYSANPQMMLNGSIAIDDLTPHSANSIRNKSMQIITNSIQMPTSAKQPILSANSITRSNSNLNLNSANSTSNHNLNNKNINVNIRNYEEMKKWSVDLKLRGAKVYEVIHDRQGNNDKELTVKSGELVEVLDDKRNWWKLRNFYGLVGHAPVTILRPFEIADSNNNQMYDMKFPAKSYY